MALYTYHHDAPAVVAAAQQWVEQSLILDGSVFADERVSTADNFDALDTYFVKRPDEGTGSFYEKLDIQLRPAPAAARKLMAELIWALLLFPSNINADTKRNQVVLVWRSGGGDIASDHPLLKDSVLGGIGSGGPGIHSNRWREVAFMVEIGRSLKSMAEADRRRTLTDYDAFLGWINKVDRVGDRQFRHMFRYLLFPERVERMSSTGERRRVLAAFGVAPEKDIWKWDDRALDDALFKLRAQKEKELGTTEIDFYVDPLRSRWKTANEDDDATVGIDAADGVPASSKSVLPTVQRATNLILYGPPGTGKTWRLKSEYFKKYIEKAADVDRGEWLQQLVAPFGWRAVIAAALAALGKPAKADAVFAHELVGAKAIQRQRTKNVLSSVWGYMQAHSSPESKTVNVSDRRPPYIFDKGDSSFWTLLEGWQESDPEAAELHLQWAAGQGKAKAEDVLRYRVVTFHPSYTYEDFVIGLRPVTDVAQADGSTGFRMVDGVFKQICADARANPGKRYALFIDEINRANIAKVFGELITLIEPDKRARYDSSGRLVAGIEVQLPGTADENGGAERFGVPENLDIIGTMNTADRSIALLDIALRRRFEFEEIAPDYNAIRRRIGGIDLAELLKRMNDRIEYLADRDRLIGHGYFTRVSTLLELREAFRGQVIPLLQEYFFDDLSRVALVLSNGTGKSPFLRRESLRPSLLFAPSAELTEDRDSFVLTPYDSWSEADFRSIYEVSGKGD